METLRKLKETPTRQAGDPAGVLAYELLSAVKNIHLLHLGISGPGSFAAHTALGSFYADLQELTDSFVEEYQGATQKLLGYPQQETYSRPTTVEEGIVYLDSIYGAVHAFQMSCPYSEIKNTLDDIKSEINSAKYKLKFLK